MKFATLALAVLLAVGCQAASLQADAPASLPGYLEQARGYMRIALDQIKDSAHRIADKITDETTKNAIKARADTAHASVLNLQQQVGPLTDSAVQTLEEASRDMRASIFADIENLKKELEPLRTDLRATIERHVQSYQEKMLPVVQEYRKVHEAQMADLKTRFEPQLAELRVLIDTNVEETKSKVEPIVEKIRVKLTERAESLRMMIDPYVQEYREQLKKMVADAQNADYQDVAAKLKPKIDGVKESFGALFTEIQGLVGQEQ